MPSPELPLQHRSPPFLFLCSSSSPVDRKHYIMLLWEMLLLLGYHQLTPRSIFRRMLRDVGVGEGSNTRDGGHERKESKRWKEREREISFNF